MQSLTRRLGSVARSSVSACKTAPRVAAFHSSKALSADVKNDKSYQVLDDVTEFPTANFDHYRRDNINADTNKVFSYAMLGGTAALTAGGAKSTVVNLLSTMSMSSATLAMANLEYDLTEVPEGTTVTVKWRGKPLFIRHRTAEEISDAEAVPLAALKDPQSDADRRKKAEYIIAVGICTHLGCVPLSNAGDYNGWYCPCHGSHYDTSGRIRRGPAPFNLEVPPYSFITDSTVLIGGST